MASTNKVLLTGQPDQAMAVTIAGSYATLSLSTNPVTVGGNKIFSDETVISNNFARFQLGRLTNAWADLLKMPFNATTLNGLQTYDVTEARAVILAGDSSGYTKTAFSISITQTRSTILTK